MAQKQAKQFDLSEIKVDPNLQGATLASFQKRLLAFGIDWAIILLASQYLPFVVLIGLIFLAIKKKMRSSYQWANETFEQTLQSLDHQFEKQNIDRKVRVYFNRYTRIYFISMMILFVLVTLGMWLGIVIGAFYWEHAELVLRSEDWIKWSFKPIQIMSDIFGFLVGTIGGVIYFSIFTWKWEGQTVGKRLLKIRVVKLNGEKISLWNSFERVSGYVSSASLFLSGFFQYFWDKNHQTTHDKIVETIVILDTPKIETPQVETPQITTV